MSYSKQQVKNGFDFEEWSNLASNDPDAFEQRRQDFLEEYIKRYPHERQRRLKGLQFRIDMERRRARTPLAACIKLSSMMWDSITGDDGFVSTVKLLIDDAEPVTRKPQNKTSATILTFKPKNTSH